MDKRLQLVLAALVLSIVAFNFWEQIPRFWLLGVERKPYYILLALSVTCSAIALYSLTKKHPIAFSYLAFTINNLLDELIFTPTVSQYSEYIFAGLAVGYAVYMWDRSKSLTNEEDAKV